MNNLLDMNTKIAKKKPTLVGSFFLSAEQRLEILFENFKKLVWHSKKREELQIRISQLRAVPVKLAMIFQKLLHFDSFGFQIRKLLTIKNRKTEIIRWCCNRLNHIGYFPLFSPSIHSRLTIWYFEY